MSLMMSIQNACMEYRAADATRPPKTKATTGALTQSEASLAAAAKGKGKSDKGRGKGKDKGKGKGEPCDFCGKNGHTEAVCFKKANAAKLCQTCGKTGHLSVDCFQNPSSKNYKGANGVATAERQWVYYTILAYSS